MISIDRLRLALPPGFEGRGDAVARWVAEELAALPAPAAARLESLPVPPITVDPALGDREVARRIAEAVHGRLGAAPEGKAGREGA